MTCSTLHTTYLSVSFLLLLQNNNSCTDAEVERFQEVYRSGCPSYLLSVDLVQELLDTNRNGINDEEAKLLRIIYTPTANAS